ncbi:MAG: hypothetical protein NZ529_04910 [Cytophagaceae bacterium]|nr:hypothetical protein [Cytophagaceae bacterium]MDW8456115.1 hypothetical protein [Cytophagaceae bacterium]
MNTFFFWNGLTKPYRLLYVFALVVFFISVVLSVVAYVVGLNGVVAWDVQTQFESIKISVENFYKNTFPFEVPAHAYIASDRIIASEIQVNEWYAYVFLILFFIGLLYAITTITYLHLYAYVAGMLMFMYIIVNMKLEIIEIAGRTDRWFALIFIALYSGLSYYFHSFNKGASFLFRLICFSTLTIAIAIFITFTSGVAYPFLHIANFGSTSYLLITLLFMLLIAYDIIKAFLFITSSSNAKSGKNHFTGFFFITLLYMANLFLLFLKKLYVIDVNIVYINPLILYLVSAILGIWMFRKRTEMFSHILPFSPAGAYLYIGVAIMSTAGIAYSYINGNIGMTEAYERIIVFSHLFMGFTFSIYVIVNFLPLFRKHVSVYENVYKPVRMTFMAVPAIAITIGVVVFIYSKKYPYHLALSGYYTFAGDVMLKNKDYHLAIQYYKKATGYDFPNHRANYSIASLSHYLNDYATAKKYYTNALVRDHSLHAYIGLSNAQLDAGEYFQSMFTLKEAIQKYPKSGELYNNLGVVYTRTDILDTTNYYFLKCLQYMPQSPLPYSNMAYNYLKKNMYNIADSILTENFDDHISYNTNRIASKLLNHSSDSILFNQTFFKRDILLPQVAYLNNYTFYSLNDTSWYLLTLLDTLINKSETTEYQTKLRYLRAMKKYYSENKIEAIQDMYNLKNTTLDNKLYATTLGCWMLQNNVAEECLSNFSTAYDPFNHTSAYNLVLAQLFYNVKPDPFVLNALLNSKEQHIQKQLNAINYLLNTSANASTAKTSEEKLLYIATHCSRLPAPSNAALYESLTLPEHKLIASYILMDNYLSKNDLEQARKFIYHIEQGEQHKAWHVGELNFQYLRLLFSERNYSELSPICSTTYLNTMRACTRAYFTNFVNEKNIPAGSLVTQYSQAINNAPFFYPGVEYALNFLYRNGYKETAYEKAAAVSELNPSSAEARKLYLKQCILNGYTGPAENTLENLKPFISAAEYSIYRKTIDSLLNTY